ncbi:MAG: 5-formyltetrahydrofolate cyclo-ligase [Gammaproteobacteria bacterium]
MRHELRLRRRGVTGSRRALATRAIVARLRRLPAFRAARTIALYWPADGEPDVRALAPEARARGKRLYLPVVGHGGRMRFAPWEEHGRLRRNRYGIPEPLGPRWWQSSKLDLVIAPLVAFDSHCRRLGMGGGYYDRALQRRRRKPVLVGAAFALQEVPAVPDQPWDVPLDLVVTERGRHKRGARA